MDFRSSTDTHTPVGESTSRHYKELDSVSQTEPVTDSGRQLYIDPDSPERGSRGGLYPVYTDPSRSDRYGYLCGTCESTAVGMDPMGRLVCAECGNERKPTQWDAAYL